MTRYLGRLLQLLAVGHTAYGLVWFHSSLGEWLDPLAMIPVTSHRYEAEAMVFFFWATPLLFAFGSLVHWTYERVGSLPASVGWWLLGTSLVLGVIAPLSGAVLLLGIAAVWLSSTRHARTA